MLAIYAQKKLQFSMVLMFVMFLVFSVSAAETVFEVKGGNKQVGIGNFFPIDPSVNYQASFTLRGANGTAEVGLQFYDSKNRLIWPHSVNPIAGTETVLAANAVKGSNFIMVKDASRWLPKGGPIVVFNAQNDLSDLPNFEFAYHITRISRSGDAYRIEFSGKVPGNYAAGTVVRQHRGGGWMNFAYRQFKVAPEAVESIALLNAAKLNKPIANRIWDKAAKARFFVKSAAPLTVEKLDLKAMMPGEEPELPVCRILQGRELKNAVRIFSPTQSIMLSDAVGVNAVNSQSGFYNMTSVWPADRVKQMEFTVAADQPGYVRFVCAREEKGKKTVVKTNPHSVIPDGKYRTLIFDFSKDPAWIGRSSNWELRWFGSPGKVFLKKIAAREFANAIPDLTGIPVGTPVRTALLQPLKRYRLEYVGQGTANGTLRFFNRNMQEIPDCARTLSNADKMFEFTVPEMAAYAEFTATEAAAGGYARLFMLPQEKHFWRGQWIWSHPGSGPENYSVWFEKIIDLETLPEYAAYAVSADDVSYLYVNGRLAGSSNNWHLPKRYEFTKLLKKGRNRITFRVHNYAQNAALLADFYIKLKDQEIFFATDSSWRCESKSNKRHEIPKKIDQQVHVFGPPGVTQPWATGEGFRYVGTQGTLEMLESKPGKITAIVRQLPVFSSDNLRFELRSKGKVIHDLVLPVKPAPATWKLNGKVTIEYNVPTVLSGEAELHLADDYVRIINDPCLAKLQAAPRKSDFLPARFIPGALPQIQLGNKIYPSVYWNSGSLTKAPDQVIRARQNGFCNYRLYVDFINFYLAPGKFDFRSVNEQITRILSIDKDAVFSFILRTHMPDWYLMQNPGHVSKHYGNHRRKADRDKQALASKKWLADAEEPIKAFIEHLRNSGFADRVWGVGIAENGNGEWFWGNVSGDGKRSWAGYSQGDHEAFRDFLKKRYSSDSALAKAWNQPDVTLADAMMAPPRAFSAASCGELMNPLLDRQVMDTAEFRNIATGEALIELCRLVKKYSHGKLLTGAYFGYHTELAENPSRPIQLTGHNAFLEVAKSPYVDCVYAPSRYTYRKVGHADNIMQPWSSFALRNKVVYVEQDVRNALGPQDHDAMKVYVGQSSTVMESIGQLNRALGMSLATGCTHYWYDIINGSFKDKVMNDCLREHLEIVSKLPPPQGLLPVEVAVVSSRESIYHTRTAHENGIFTGAISGLYFKFNNLAVPYRSLVIEDLLDKSLQVPAHKFYIMLPSLVLSAEERAGLMKRFENEKATVLWLYTAGANYPDKAPAAANCGDFFGMKFAMSMEKHKIKARSSAAYGNIEFCSYNAVAPLFYPLGGYDTVIAGENNKPVVVKKLLNGAVHIFSSATDLPIELYEYFCKESGVHRYTSSLADPVWAGNDVIFLHAAVSGKKSFNIPENCRLRSIIGPFKGTLENKEEFEAQAAVTYGFIMENK